MDQGWKQLPLLVMILLFWRSADGFRGGAHSNAHPDTLSPRAVQSSMSEARVTGALPVEEVGSSLFPSRPLKSRSKFNLLQFVKGGSISSQSTSHAQTAPSSSVSASLPLPVDAQPSSGLTSSGSAFQGAADLTSSGSTFQGAASGLSLQTQYAASGPVTSTQGASSYPAELVSGQSTSDSLPVSSSLETYALQPAEASLPVFSQESISHSSSSAPGAIFQSSPVFSEGTGQHVPLQGEGSYSGLSQGAFSQYTPDSNTKLSSTSSSPSTGDQSSPSLSSSSQGSSGMFLASGSSYLAEAAGLGHLDFSAKSPETSSLHLPMPLVSSQSTNGQGTPSLLMVGPQSSLGSVSYSSLSSQAQGSASSQSGSGAEFSPSYFQSSPAQVGSDSYSGLPQSLSASSLYTPESLMSNKLDTLPLGVSSQSTSAKSSPSVSMSSTRLATSSSYLPVQGGSSSPSLSLGTVSASMSAPQAMYSQSTGSRSSYRTVSQFGSPSQTGASGQFTSQGGNYYSGLASQSQAVSSPSVSGNLKPISSPQGTSSQATSVLSSPKQFTSTSQGSSGASFGASTGFASQGISSSSSGSVQSQGSTSQFSPGADSQSTTVQSSRKQFISSYGTQTGSSAPFTLQGSFASGGSPLAQGTASQLAPVSPSHPSALSPSQGVASQSTIHVSRKQFTSTYTGSSGAQAGSSAPFTLQGNTAYGGSPQPQDTASQFAPGSSYASVSLSSPQAIAGPTTVQSSRKQFTSASQDSSGALFGASTGFASQGMSSSYSGSVQSQGTASPFAPGSPSSYAGVSLSLPQAGPSTAVQASLKRPTSTYMGSSDTQAGSSTRFTLQGSTAYGAPLSQGTASQFAPGSQSYYTGVSLSSPQAGPSTAVQGSLKQPTSTYMGSSGTQAGSSTLLGLQGSTTYGASLPQGTASQLAPVSSPYASVSLSSPQGLAGPTTVQSSQKRLTSTFTGSSGTQAGSSTRFTLQGSTAYASPQSQGTASQFAPGSQLYYTGVSLSSPQAGPSTAVQASLKRPTSTYMGSSDTQAGSSTRFTLQGSTAYASPQSQGTASQFAPGSQSYYTGVSLSSPQAGPSTAGQGSLKQPTSTYMGSFGTQAGSSTLLGLQGSTTYGASLPQGTTSQLAPGFSPYASVSLSSPQGVAGSTAVQSSRKQLASTFTGSSGAQFGASTGFASAVSSRYSGSSQSQGTANQFAPGSPSSYAGVSLSSPLAGPSTAVQASLKQPTSTYMGSSDTQAGSSTRFTLQGSTAYVSPQSQGTTSQFAPGSQSYYAGVSLSSPQGVAGSTTVPSSRKQLASTFTGSSGAQFGASTGLASEGVSSRYSGSVQSQGTASQFAPGSLSSYESGSLSSPQAVAGPTTVQGSRKQFTFRGSSGTQTGSSTLFTLQGSTAYGESPQPQDAASEFASGSPTPYASVSLSSPQGVAGQSSQAYQSYSVSQSQKSQRWQPSATRWIQGVQISDSAASQGSSTSQSSPIQFSSLSSAGGSPSGVSGQFVSAQGGGASYSGSFQSQGLSTKYNPGSQLYDLSAASQGTSSASASKVLSGYSSMYNQNAPAQPSYSSSPSHFYSVKM
ncbi:mucin-12 isoform X3 [Labeo rohita]|uniref:mucin-12 isoform X3 n=1 Tax=Labeo rohita TaxID=84645 RepID=UPI0021E2A2DA|nr:mucin-12 isoform X3 [Labeo rohita]